MAAPTSAPSNYNVQTGNGINLVSWNAVTGATSYEVQRSTDGVTFSNYATVTVLQYIDNTVTLGTAYYYQVAAVNGSGTGPYTTPQMAVPTITGEMSLSAIRLSAQQRADRVNSQFVTTQEWNTFINLALFELYDYLITVFEDYFVAPPIQITSDGSTFLYNMPNGSNTFVNPITNQTITPPPFYKLLGVDLAVNSASNAYVTVNKFNFIDRNRFVYPNTASTIYGVFNLQYRLLGSNPLNTQIEFIPTPSARQNIRLWYIPRMPQLLLDTDTTNFGVSGWLQYVIVRAAKYALDKEESDTSKLDGELIALKKRIEETATNRDAGQPDTISDVRQGNWRDGWSGGRNGMIGGW